MCSRLFSACAPPTCCPNGPYRSYADAFYWSGYGAPCCAPPLRCSPCGARGIGVPYPYNAAVIGALAAAPPSIAGILAVPPPACGGWPCALPALPVTCAPCERPFVAC